MDFAYNMFNFIFLKEKRISITFQPWPTFQHRVQNIHNSYINWKYIRLASPQEHFYIKTLYPVLLEAWLFHLNSNNYANKRVVDNKDISQK